MKKVVVYPADSGACGLYRILYPAETLIGLGYPVSVADNNSPVTDGVANRIAEEDWEIMSGTIPDCDIVVLQRPASVKAPSIIRYLKKHGIRVVVELDDNFLALTSRNQAWSLYHRKGSGQSIAALSKCVSLADRVVVSTPSLGAAYSTDVVMENCIPESFLSVPRQPEFGVLGWTGSMSVHTGDLNVVGIGVRDALRISGWDFRVVGESRGVGEELLIEGEIPQTGWLPMSDYRVEVARLGAAIAPITDDAFNRGKSWLKTLEYGAFGVPCVASALPEYERLGVALIADKPKRWKSLLAAVMTDDQLRVDLIAEGRRIAALHTYELRAEEWWDAWTG